MNEHNFKKQLGQNFLIDFESIIEFVDAADIKEGDNVLEIGPGDGAVSDIILQRKAQLTAVEIDSELIPTLNERFAGFTNFKLINADILQLDLAELGLNKGFKLIGALPYNISKQIINLFLKTTIKPACMCFILQKEVASDYAFKGRFLNILANTYAGKISYIKTLPAHFFNPEPKVESAIIKFEQLGPRFDKPESLLKFVKIAFSAPRKILSRNLANAGFDKLEIESELKKMGLSEKSRAGELAFEHWTKLYQALKK
ncbi:MAG TPA: 16S rRNA (adenine(1518)-N(6)/adenine(1519)-N(6))-dimethyltransferase RsmA [Candidatus Dojkabacteria bacterium]|jgi:16S rRNA (adenine1518-N6/adenine1519-N6)-dimethyltransferase|nr:16S rRNA (adenine(1518)-N(6)/adenine(1519)-N(6))-dimethyltransferase RsmA [Candidatus Dojkabacteria bacterium]